MFVDVWWYHDYLIEIDTDQLVAGLMRMDPQRYVIGLRLSRAEARSVRRGRADADEEVVAGLRTLTDRARAKLGITVPSK